MRRANQKLIEILETLKIVRVPAATSNNPFPSCPKPLFQRKGECKAIDKKMIFFILMEMKRFFTRKVLRLASFTNWEVLERGNSLFHCKRQTSIWTTCPSFLFSCGFSVVFFFSTRRKVLLMPGLSLRINWLCFYLLISLVEKCLT